MQRVPLSEIENNPYQVRVEYGDLSDLTGSLRELSAALPETSGLLQVPLARRVNGRIELALGHRRRRAFAELARVNDEYATFPVEIADLDDQAMADIAWHENEKRRDVSDIERALAIEIAQRDFGWTQAEVGRRWGISQSTVANLLRLLRLPEKVRGLIRTGEISGRHGRALLPLVDLDARWETFLDVLQDGAPGRYRSVERVEREVEAHIARETYALEAVDWDESWDPHVDGLRACADCPQRVKVGREFRCASSGCFMAKTRQYSFQVEGPKRAAEVYRTTGPWQATSASSYARCAGCRREPRNVYQRGEWLKCGWTYICPECAERAGLTPSPEESSASPPQPVYVRQAHEEAAPAWVQGADVHSPPPAQAESWAEFDENVDTVLVPPETARDFGVCPRCQAPLTGPGNFHVDERGPICDVCNAAELRAARSYLIHVKIMAHDEVLVYITEYGKFMRLHEATGTMSEVERLFGEALRVVEGYREAGGA
jgi:ParB family chromosome partitioning protein